MKNRPFLQRLGFALVGLRLAWRREHSFRTQTACGLIALAVLAATGAPPVWWAIVVLTIGVVLAAELMNSAFEALIDHLHPEEHPQIGRAKDIAAGAVLVTGIVALAVGGLLLAATL